MEQVGERQSLSEEHCRLVVTEQVYLHVPVIVTFPTVPEQHGVPPPMQLRPLGRQQLPRMAPDLSFAKFVQQAPSSDRQ